MSGLGISYLAWLDAELDAATEAKGSDLTTEEVEEVYADLAAAVPFDQRPVLATGIVEQIAARYE